MVGLLLTYAITTMSRIDTYPYLLPYLVESFVTPRSGHEFPGFVSWIGGLFVGGRARG
jgi:hypothetical protein